MRLILMYRGYGGRGVKSHQSQILRAGPPAAGPPLARLGYADSGKSRGTAMQILIEKMLNDFERGTLSRRQLAATLAGLAVAPALAKPALAAPSLRAITLNHVTVRVP